MSPFDKDLFLWPWVCDVFEEVSAIFENSGIHGLLDFGPILIV